MEAKDIITVIALVVGPVSAVIITLWYQRRSERRAAKRQLFVALMAHRKAAPTPEWVNALNLIDVIYADDSEVVELWHRLYDTLTTQPFNNQQFGHQYINLLSNMARSLGYRSLQQTDIDKFYAPQALGDQATLQVETQKEWLRVLKATPNLREIAGKEDN
jgi:hypothetical protein